MGTRMIGRIASAVLAGAMGLGVAGIGTASAAGADGVAGTHIDISVKAASSAQVRAGATFTDLITVTNDGQKPANDVQLLIPYDASKLKLVDIQIARDGAWVTGLSADSATAYLGRLSSGGDSVTLSARFEALPAYAGAAAASTMQTTWTDSGGDRSAEDTALLIQSASDVTAPVVQADPIAVTNNTLPVYSAGFSAGESVSFWYNAPDGSVVPLYVSGGRLTTDRRSTETSSDGSTDHLNNAQYMLADAGGAVTTSLPTKALARGSYTLVIHGATNGHETLIPFTVS